MKREERRTLSPAADHGCHGETSGRRDSKARASETVPAGTAAAAAPAATQPTRHVTLQGTAAAT